jgi:hypothetical protein
MSGEFDLLGQTSPMEAIRKATQLVIDDPVMAATAIATFIGEAKLANTDAEAAGRLRAELDAKHGAANVFDTDQLLAQFTPLGFALPYLVARREDDFKLGTLLYTKEGQPRFYHSFVPYV